MCVSESKHVKHVDVKHKLMIVRAEQQKLESLKTISLSLKGSINRGASSFSHMHSSAAPCSSHPVSVHSFIGSFPRSRLLSEAQPLTVDLKQGLCFIKSSRWMWQIERVLDPVMVELAVLWTRVLLQICGVCSATQRKRSLCLNWSWTAGKTAL